MTEAFESGLDRIFAGCEAAISERLVKEKDKAKTLGAEDTGRMAFVLTDAIEHGVRPAIDQALATYEMAINRPISMNPRWEEALRARINHAVEAAVKRALIADPADHPWKPLLAHEVPALEARLLKVAEEHFAALAERLQPRRRPTDPRVEWGIRLLIFASGLVAGGLVMKLLAG